MPAEATGKGVGSGSVIVTFALGDVGHIDIAPRSKGMPYLNIAILLKEGPWQSCTTLNPFLLQMWQTDPERLCPA